METGLHYNRYRYYSPELGRYISADPIGQFGIVEAAITYGESARIDFAIARSSGLHIGNIDKDGFLGMEVMTANLYSYAVDDPINSVDPYGDVTLRDVSNFAAGFGNVLSFGLTGLINDATGASAVIDPCSGAYNAGVAAGFAHGLATAGAGLAARGGWQVTLNAYKHGGGGVNVVKNGTRRFGADWHSFKHNGRMVNRPHYHRGATKTQRKKHRPYQGGW